MLGSAATTVAKLARFSRSCIMKFLALTRLLAWRSHRDSLSFALLYKINEMSI